MRGILFFFLLITLVALMTQSALAENRIWGTASYSNPCDRLLGDYVNVTKGIIYNEDCGITPSYYWGTIQNPPTGRYMCSARGGYQQSQCCKVGNIRVTDHVYGQETEVEGLRIGCDGTPNGGGQ